MFDGWDPTADTHRPCHVQAHDAGSVDVRVQVPPLPAGDYQLSAAVLSPGQLPRLDVCHPECYLDAWHSHSA
eukprot:3576981-Rhodomonas_salina.2